MSLDDYSLNRTALFLSEEEVQKSKAAIGKRFVNFIIDVLVCFLLRYLSVIFIFWTLSISIEVDVRTFDYLGGPILILIILIPSIYYILMEYFLGKTLGKFVTRTRVVSQEGGKPRLRQIVFRSLVRMIPLDVITFLGREGSGWHDRMSETLVVEDQNRFIPYV